MSCGDFSSTGSMYFSILQSFFDVLKVFEQVSDRFRVPKDMQMYFCDYPVDPGTVFRPSVKSLFRHWVDHGSHAILMAEEATAMVFKCL